MLYVRACLSRILNLTLNNYLKIMIQKISIFSFLCLIIILSSLYPVYSQSVYSSYGIGEIRYSVNTRSAGMGGAGLSLWDEFSINQINPAMNTYITATAYCVGLRYEGIRLNQQSVSSTSQQTSINNFGFNIRASYRFAFGGGIRPYTDLDYNIISNESGVLRKIESSGGISLGYLYGSIRVSRKFAVGFNFLLNFGESREKWSVEFIDPNYLNSESELSRGFWGSGLSLGFHFQPLPKLGFGGVYQPEITLETTDKINYFQGNSISIDGKGTKVPQSFGFGSTFDVTEKIILTGDVYKWQSGGSEDFLSNTLSDKNSIRYSIGAEYSPLLRLGMLFRQKLIYRLGFYYWDLYSSDLDNSQMSEYFVTAGLGIPFSADPLRMGLARLDLSFEGGVRSSKSNLLGSEKVFRFKLNLAGLETWFRRAPNR